MKGKCPGSSIVLFLIVMFGLTVAITQVWRVIAYSVDIALARQASYQALYCAEGIRAWAVEFVERNFENLCKDVQANSKAISFELTNWPIEIPLLSGAKCSAYIQRVGKKEFKLIAVCKHANASCATTCCVRRKKNKESKLSFVISKWSITHNNV